ncbi:homologous recombination OB-fold protein isoform X2 [Syngnathoides biaculeatus]|uniref:homologous recombination OB-fold protein isoform X2 n=1 Tax=Syngnathoides biaculeatus TaxID=300417 RepID=UPI002ADE7535|nr:homologous recombination OB-fold protein isoform X2 [Syngnathoides biaculeatus]
MSYQLNGLFSIGEDFDEEDVLGTNWTLGPRAAVPPRPSASARAAARDSGTDPLRRSASPSSASVTPTLRTLSSGIQADPLLRKLPESGFGGPPRPAVSLPPSLVAANRVGPRGSGTNLLQPTEESSSPSSKTVAPGLRNLIAEAQALRPHPPPTPEIPKPFVGTSTAVPSCPQGQETVPPTLQKVFSSIQSRPLPHPTSVPPASHSWAQPSSVPTTIAALRPLGTAPVTPGAVTKPPLTVQQKSTINTTGQDDFDDWDLDLVDLEECDRLAGPVPPAKTTNTGGRTLRAPTLRPPCTLPPQSVPTPNSVSKTFGKPQHVPRVAPATSHPPRGLFEAISPEPRPPPSPSPAFSPHPLSKPLLTNHLVQLVSASSKMCRKRPRSEPRPPRSRRFPGPAGLLPQQPQNHNLDEIVVSVSQTPSHSVGARLPNQVSSSQTEEEEFSSGPWAAMKAQMGLDERNPACFLRSYSVLMVLRKAALKQLNKNKVPNMAVMLKSINHAHTDAKAVFRDPTGEIQGTLHRRLLEERSGELKVGVFSPSHRNHYLNVTPNNLLRIYSPDGACHASGQPPPAVPEPTPGLAGGKAVSRMQLVFDDGDGDEDRTKSKDRSPPNSGWDADDLDELLVALPEDTYSL